jgi:hypothetical protein
MDGAPLNAVQRQMGHSKASTTLDIYAHVNPAVLREQALRMAELLVPVPKSEAGKLPPTTAPSTRAEDGVA